MFGLFCCATVETDWTGGYQGLCNGRLFTHLCNVSGVATVHALSVVSVVGTRAPLPFCIFAGQSCKITSESIINLSVCPSTYYFKVCRTVKVFLVIAIKACRGNRCVWWHTVAALHSTFPSPKDKTLIFLEWEPEWAVETA